MAEYRDLYAEFRAAGAEVAALAVDGPEHSEAVRQQYQLPFPILCDTRREAVQAWGLFNREERGGIAHPASFVLDPGLGVRWGARDGHATRVRAADMLAFVRGGSAASGGAHPHSRVILPGWLDWLRTLWPNVRLALFPPRK